MGELFDKLKAWLESPEGQAELEKERKEMEFQISLTDRWLGKFNSFTPVRRAEIIEKCISKYESAKYRDREWLHFGREPLVPLYWYLYDYAEKYCNDTLHYEDENPFYHKCYVIDDKYVVRYMRGQGCVVNVWRK